jgi:hypothetical protein
MGTRSTVIAILLAATVAGCGQKRDAQAPAPPSAPVQSAPAPNALLPPVAPPAPGTPGGLPDDRTPLAEGPIDPESAQGAGQVAQSYFALIEAGEYARAFRLREPDPALSQAAFVADLSRYADYHAQIGAPGRVEGAAGSLYVEIPVVIYGRLKSGEPVHLSGPVTLRRVNDVPGSTAAQRRWRISKLDLR